MLLPRALFERLGGFDEGYRLHAEDLDLCRRARAAGAIVAVANDVARAARARRVQPRAAAVRGVAQAPRAVALLPQVRGARRGVATRMAVFAAIWLRFPLAVARAAWRAR